MEASPSISDPSSRRLRTPIRHGPSPTKARSSRARGASEKRRKPPNVFEPTTRDPSANLTTPHDTQMTNSNEESRFPATPKPSRKQANRAAKLTRSVEESVKTVRSPSYGVPATPSSTDSTSRPVARASQDAPEQDEDWAPSKAATRELSFGESPEKATYTPTRTARVSSECSDSSWQNADIRQRRLEEDGFVEQDGVEFLEIQYKTAKKRRNGEISEMKEAWQAAVRKQKGKQDEDRGEKRKHNSSEGTLKRKSAETGKSRARPERLHQRIKRESSLDEASAAPPACHASVQSVLDGEVGQRALSVRPFGQASWGSEPVKHENERPDDSTVPTPKVEQLLTDLERSTLNEQTSAKANADKTRGRILKGPGMNCGSSPTKQADAARCKRRSPRKSHDRREVDLPSPRRLSCKCAELPEYFRRRWLEDPDLASFPGGKLEFMTHVKQIAGCPGHKLRLIDSCRLILNNETRAEWVSAIIGKIWIADLMQMQEEAEGSRITAGENNESELKDATDFAQDWLAADLPANPLACPPRTIDRGEDGRSQTQRHPKRQAEEQVARQRQQSSIGPEKFYGLSSRPLPPPTLRDALQTTPEASKNAADDNKNQLLKQTPRTNDTTQEKTPPTSSPCASNPAKGSKPTKRKKRPTPTSEIGPCRPSKKTKSTLTPPTSSPPREKSISPPLIDPTRNNLPPLFHDEDVLEKRTKNAYRAPSNITSPHIPPEFSAKRKRHQSLPPSLVGLTKPASRFVVTQPATRTLRDRALQELSTNTSLLSGMVEEIAKVVEEKLQKHLPQITTNSNIQNNGLAPAPPPPPPPPTVPTNTHPARRRRSKMTLEERKRRYPEQSSDVPHHLRKPEAEIIQIGKFTNPYERHRAAPYAFGYWGTLRKEYRPLITRSNGRGGTVWTADEIARVQK